MADPFDVAVIGAGAAGMMCAAVAGQRGRRVVLLDHAEKLAEKIRISGGGRCNFTNREVGPAHFISEHRDFARPALERYPSREFVALVRSHGIDYHEKHRGQLFCDDSSDRIIAMLVAECERGRVQWRRPVRVEGVTREAGPDAERFVIATGGGPVTARRLVVATGGLSIPKIGATDFAYRLARQFGLRVIEPRPALVPLTFGGSAWAPLAALSGLSMDVEIRCDEGWEPTAFREDLLVTHRGLSGPAILQISNYWKPGAALSVDLLPTVDLERSLLARKDETRQNLSTVLAEWLPRRWVDAWMRDIAKVDDRRLAEVSNAALSRIAAGLKRWTLRPDGSEGYRKAEVTGGGVDTAELSDATMEARRIPGLYFIGESVDMTGWLGGYNFQWAWASGVVAGEAA